MTPPPASASAGALRAGLRLAAFAGWTLVLLPVQLAALAVGRGEAVPRLYHRCVLPLLGIRVERRGTASRARPTLFVCNHSSYVDIIVLGALVGASFVAKREVASWPLFGQLARLQRSVFIDRRRIAAADQRDQVAARLHGGDNLILFPEGTSNDGNRVLPFKSALFAAAGGATVIQPVSIAYVGLNGTPLLRHQRPHIAWYGDMELAGHLWRLLALGELSVSVEFHAPVAAADFPSRKALADHCHRIVARGVSNALRGRLTQP